MKRKVLVVSDIHTGAVTGLWPPGLDGPWENKIGLNPGQRYLWECWQDLIEWKRREKPDVLIINGDLIDGEQRKSLGAEAVVNLVAAQQKGAIQVLAPLCEGTKKIYVIRGSAYHDGRLGFEIEPIAAALGAIGPTKDYHTWPLVDLDVDGVVLNVMHQIGSMSGSYRYTALDKEGMWMSNRGKEGYVPQADIAVRSHLHYYGHIESLRHHVVITPCWQLQTDYMRRHSAYRMMPDIGAIVIDIDPEAKKSGEDPIHIRKRIYKLPARKVAKVEMA